MGRSAASNAGRRRYDNRLREEHAAQTRERVLEATLAVFADSADGSFSVGRVAKEAGVSEPTIYRHFGSKDGLFEAFGSWFEHRFDHPGMPDSVEGFVEVMPKLFEFFSENAAFIRAGMAPGNQELLAAGRRKRRARVDRVMRGLTAHLPPAKGKAMRAALAHAAGSSAWLALTDQFGIPPREAGEAVAFILDAAMRALQAEAERGSED